MTMERIEKSDIITPEDFDKEVQMAQAKAAVLKKIVDAQKLSVNVGGASHLKVEAWVTIGKAYGYTAWTEVINYERDASGKLLWVEARATVLDNDGVKRGGGSSICEVKEPGKQGMTAAQVGSMAQTRAESRAFKQLLSWVVILAGYNPTPAEEMEGLKDSKDSTEYQAAAPSHTWQAMLVTENQLKRLWAIAKTEGVGRTAVLERLLSEYKLSDPGELNRKDYELLIAWIESTNSKEDLPFMTVERMEAGEPDMTKNDDLPF